MLISPGTVPHIFSLKPEYFEELQNRKVQWRLPGLSEFTFIRTYSRRKPNGKLENWNECVLRVIQGMFTILKTHAKINHIVWDEEKAQRLAREAADRMFQFKWLPPGRGLWIMGTQFMWERGSAALNNCFTGDTEFLSYGDAVSLQDAFHAEEKVAVLDHRNRLQTATVEKFGKQVVRDVVLKPLMGRSNYEITYSVTADHRWLLSDGTETTSLTIGDRIRSVPLRVVDPHEIPGYRDGFAHGFVFGDGSRHTYYPDRFQVRVCGEKDAVATEVLKNSKYFFNQTSPESYGKDPMVWLKSAETDLKALPYGKPLEYIQGFISGWMTADGSVKRRSGTWRLDTQNVDAAIWLMKSAYLGGYCVTGHSIENNDTNYGPRSAPLHRISLTREPTEYRVERFENERKEEVYCVVQPETHSFHLAGGIPTGNCGFTSTELMGVSREETTLPFRFLMDMSMLGVGVGFDTKGAQNNIPVLGYSTEREVFAVEDTREGWVDLIGRIIENGIFGGPQVIPDTRKVREAGLPIRGFGGVSSGPEPLVKCAIGISDVLTRRSRMTDNLLRSTDIVDLQNLIGKCVVAGNVRRSAEIAFSTPEDEEFFTMKNWSTNGVEMGIRGPQELLEASPEDYHAYNENLWDTRNGVARAIVEKYRDRPWSYKFGGWRWSSNNSLLARVGMDYQKYEASISEAGEPGFAWLDLMQRYGRLKEPENNLDHRARGGNPCLEQTLEPYELCCLVENFPSFHEDYWDFQRTLKFSYMYAKTVTLMGTHVDRTNSVIIRNRRIGCSMSGISDAIAKFNRTPFLHQFCDQGYEYIKYIDRKYSEWLGIPQSIKKTSVKPSGTVSLVAGVFGPGVHFPKMKTGYRLVRVAKNSELVDILTNANYRVEPAVSDPLHTVVVYFPWVSPENVVTEEETTIWEKFKMAADLQYWWADNQVSCTVEFSAEEAKSHQIARCLEAFDGQLKGISLLPKAEGVYPQMPYTQAPRDEVLAYRAQLLDIDFSMLTNEGENLEANKYCDSAGCEV